MADAKHTPLTRDQIIEATIGFDSSKPGHILRVARAIESAVAKRCHSCAMNIEVLAALVALRKACDAVRPFTGVVAPINPNLEDALKATDFIDAIVNADAAIAKATGEHHGN